MPVLQQNEVSYLSGEDKQELFMCWVDNFYSVQVSLANILTNLTDENYVLY